MNSDAIIALMESADTELDRFDSPITDWDDIEELIGDANPSWFSLKCANLPLIGNYIKKQQFDKITTSYDILVNFVESHEVAHILINEVIQDRKYINIIIEETRVNIHKAEEYNIDNIEAVFPEICKSIQTRRAEYSLLVKENHNIDNMVHHGQIEEKDACQLRDEIEKKLFYLETHAPEITFEFQPSRIVHYSDLSVIFSHDQLMKYTENVKFEEKMFEKKQCIVSLEN